MFVIKTDLLSGLSAKEYTFSFYLISWNFHARSLFVRLKHGQEHISANVDNFGDYFLGGRFKILRNPDDFAYVISSTSSSEYFIAYLHSLLW